MKHEKTFAAINKLKDVELELHRLKNALEMANRALDAQRPWVGLTGELTRNELLELANTFYTGGFTEREIAFARVVLAKSKEKNT